MTMKLKQFKLIAILMVAVLLTTACGANAESIYDDKGQVFRKALSQDMTTFDAALATDNISFEIMDQVFEGLYVLNEEDEAEPGVAKGMPKKSDDGKTLTIDLRKDAKWSNGDPVTADDFVYSWRRVVNPDTASEYAYIMYDLKNAEAINQGKKKPETLGVKALGKYKLQVELTKPLPYINELLAFGTYLPVNQKAIKKYGEQYGTTADKVIYNGAFKATNWAPEDKIEMVKNDKYWDSDAVKLTRVNYKIIKDQQAGASLFDTGSIDDTGISSEQVDKYKDSPALDKQLLASTWFLTLNQEKPEFKNKSFRLALAQAIDKEQYSKEVLNNGSKTMDQFTSKETFKSPDDSDYTDGIESNLQHDPKAAKKNLEKAKKELGKDEITFTFTTNETPDDKVSAEYLKSQIENNLPGVTMKIKTMPGKQRINAMLTGDFEVGMAGWGPDYADPLTFLEIMTSDNPQNYGKWSNKKYDQLVKDANGKLLTDLDARDAALKEAEEIMLDDVAVAPIFQQGQTHLTNPQVKGLKYHKIGGNLILKNVYIDKSIDRETGKKKTE